jgi:hypothetical protein
VILLPIIIDMEVCFYENESLKSVLEKFKYSLKKDFEAYFNHVNRVFEYCRLLDDSESNYPKYAVAAIFHDLGIWTENTFDYLNPSIKLAERYLITIGKEEWFEEVSIMIDMHHKVSKYKRKYSSTVEVFRQADWADVSLGAMRFKIPLKDFRAINETYPNKGFHVFLANQTFKRLVSHPFNPLPMFKK